MKMKKKNLGSKIKTVSSVAAKKAAMPSTQTASGSVAASPITFTADEATKIRESIVEYNTAVSTLGMISMHVMSWDRMHKPTDPLTDDMKKRRYYMEFESEKAYERVLAADEARSNVINACALKHGVDLKTTDLKWNLNLDTMMLTRL